MNIQTRFRIRPGGRYYNAAQRIADEIRSSESDIRIYVRAGYLEVITPGPLNPTIANNIINVFINIEAGQELEEVIKRIFP